VALAAFPVGLEAQLSQPGTQASPSAAQSTMRLPVSVAAAAGTESATEVAAYKALNANHMEQAEVLFKVILEKEPNNSRALAGMGYIRMQQGNFLGAISFLEQARQGNANDKALADALETARFWFLMGEGQAARNENDLTMAEKQYRAALQLRPGSGEALTALAGTLVKARQPGAAAALYERVVQQSQASLEGWRGLFLTEVEAGNPSLALATDKNIPAAVHAQLMQDAGYLRGLAGSYSAVGRDGDAQKTLQAALQLPFAADATNLKAEIQVQLAGILLDGNHLEQAATLYSQVLAVDHGNGGAWQGLVRVQHAMGRDQEALATVEDMPPTNYATAMRDPGFETTVASIYQAEKKLDVAQDLLQKVQAEQTAAGQKTQVGVEMQLAGIYMERGNPTLAVPIYRKIVTDDPSRVDAWGELLFAMHAAGSDKEAAVQMHQIPAVTLGQLESNVNTLQTMASVYQALGQSQQALALMNRVQQIYAAQHTAAPVDIDIQNAWLLYNSENDVGLYRQLMNLGGRPDLTVEQCRTVQAIWTNWAVRRANQTAASGNSKRALAILNAAARAFPDNPAVLKTLANGYAHAGQPEQAVIIYKAQNMSSAGVEDYEAAVGAALAANDKKVADTWLHYAMAAFPTDPRILILAARLEQSRGNTTKAIDYYRASLKAMPPEEPGAELAAALRLPAPTVASSLPSAQQAQDLSILLAPENNGNMPGSQVQPYLPSYGYYGTPYGEAPNSAPNGSPPGGVNEVVPPYMTNPGAQPDSSGNGKLNQNGPQSRLDQGAYSLPSQAEVEMRVREGVARALGASEHSSEAAMQADAQIPGRAEDARIPPRTAVAVRLGDSTPHASPPQAEVTDVLPTVRTLSNARAGQTLPSHPELAASQAAGIRRRQSNSGTARTGQSSPQIVRPDAPPTGQGGSPPDTGAQQYPQPRVAPAAAENRTAGRSAQTAQHTVTRSTPTRSTARSSAQPPAVRPSPPAADASTSVSAPQPTSPAANPAAASSAGAGQPLGGQPYPLIGPPYPLPTNSELRSQNLPPSAGRYQQQAPTAMTPRQEAESGLESLEGSYSAWWGGTAIGRVRSGTAGLDRLSDFEAPVEASAVLGQSARLTAIALPVFLNSGTLNTAAFTAGNLPYLGTMPANSANPPAQQLSYGIGGEVQITTKNIGLAAGYTPYNFPVQNITGHLSLRFFAGHVTIFGDRDPVKDTQLSYAGLHDPATITPFYLGNPWGGVVSSTGGARVDVGSGGSGFYLSGDGGILHGYHVLDNSKFEGSMGAYLRAKNWPTVGSLTLGASLFAMHYHYDEVGMSYGQGGYFSPNSYFLASVPVSFNGAYKSKLNYLVSGALGMHTFDQDWEYFYPLDAGLQANLQATLGCSVAQLAAHTCAEYPVSGNTGFNYNLNSEVSYRFGEHWYLGGFVSANNTNNYNTVTSGFFFRYAVRRQHASEGYPTGLFPVDGFRPLRVP
jgi:tetratricopeptide (TPR) repeat protein